MLGRCFIMSVENAKKFFEDLKTDSKLQDELTNIIEKNNNLSDEEKKNEITNFAKTKGYDFVPDDLDSFETSILEFSNDELAGVAGGEEQSAGGLEIVPDKEDECKVLM